VRSFDLLCRAVGRQGPKMVLCSPGDHMARLAGTTVILFVLSFMARMTGKCYCTQSLLEMGSHELLPGLV
jgi:hypothetical protein